MSYSSASVTSFFSTLLLFFFFNDTPTTEIYTLSLHDALPIFRAASNRSCFIPRARSGPSRLPLSATVMAQDRKSTRLNSSHTVISYAVFCLKKKKKYQMDIEQVSRLH